MPARDLGNPGRTSRADLFGSRSEEVILKELGGDSGTIQSDGLKAYKKVEAFRNLLPDKWTKKEQSK